jgi:cobalt-zinc-cadmium efflux system membrane fusion protein
MKSNTSRSRPRLIVALASAAVLIAIGYLWLPVLHADAARADTDANPVLQHAGSQIVVPEHSALRRSLVIQSVAEQAVQAPFALPATVEADPARLVKVLPPLAGRIVSLDKHLGDSVKVGDLLFRIDSPDFAQAVSDAQKAQAAVTLTRQALDRQQQLAAAEIAVQHDVEQAQNDFVQASSELARANAKLAQLGAGFGAGSTAGTDAHGIERNGLAVRSPIAGRVVDLNAAQGGYWNDTTAALLTVADLSSVYVTANADESELAAIFVGQSASVTLDAYPDQPLTGKVSTVGELLDPDTRRVKVRLWFDNHDGRLKPGMFARATLLAQPHRGLLVPAATVVQSGFYSRVFVEVAPWRFEARVVRLGPQLGDQIEIVSGLKSGERVVVRDGVLLDD